MATIRISRARKEFLAEYATAAVNLYGTIGIEDFVEVFNHYNAQESTTQEEATLALARLAKSDDVDYTLRGDILSLHEPIEATNIMLENQKGKPRYLPNRGQFLKYVDGDHIEPAAPYQELKRYMVAHRIQPGEGNIDLAVVHVHSLMQIGNFPNALMHYLSYMDYQFESTEDLAGFIEQINRAAQSTRMYVFNGYTLQEFDKLKHDSEHQVIPFPTARVRSAENVKAENVKADTAEGTATPQAMGTPKKTTMRISGMRKELIVQYATAAIHLYGVLNFDEMAHVFNHYEAEQTTGEEVELALRRYYKTANDDDVNYAMTGEYIYNDEYFDREDEEFQEEIRMTRAAQAPLPHYLPTVDEFLKYEQGSQMELGKPYTKLRAYILKHDIMPEDDRIYIDVEMDELQDYFQYGYNPIDVLEYYNGNGYAFKSENIFRKFLDLLSDAYMNTRLYRNNGHTIAEMRELFPAK